MIKESVAHITVKTVIKTANIDRGIVLVVKWLNSFDSVYTLYSCEDNGGKATVIFMCFSIDDIKKIVESIYVPESFVKVNVSNGYLRYELISTDLPELIKNVRRINQ